MEIDDSYVKNATAVKDIVLRRLLLDKVITPEQEEKYNVEWQIIIVKKSWYKRLADKMWKDSDSEYKIVYVKFSD